MTQKVSSQAIEFHVDTRFQQMARRPGGISREVAIAQAQGEIEAAKPDMEQWLDGELRQLCSLVDAAAAGTLTGTGWVRDANEHCRQLRNAGATIGLELLSHVADLLCDMLDRIGAGAECNVSSVKCCADSLLLARRDEYRYLRPDQVPELTEGLRRIVDLPPKLP